jgi:hypothetical protein
MLGGAALCGAGESSMYLGESLVITRTFVQSRVECMDHKLMPVYSILRAHTVYGTLA